MRWSAGHRRILSSKRRRTSRCRSFSTQLLSESVERPLDENTASTEVRLGTINSSNMRRPSTLLSCTAAELDDCSGTIGACSVRRPSTFVSFDKVFHHCACATSQQPSTVCFVQPQSHKRTYRGVRPPYNRHCRSISRISKPIGSSYRHSLSTLRRWTIYLNGYFQAYQYPTSVDQRPSATPHASHPDRLQIRARPTPCSFNAYPVSIHLPPRPTAITTALRRLPTTDNSITLVTGSPMPPTTRSLPSLVSPRRRVAQTTPSSALHISQQLVDKRDLMIWFHIYRGPKCAAKSTPPANSPAAPATTPPADYTPAASRTRPRRRRPPPRRRHRSEL